MLLVIFILVVVFMFLWWLIASFIRAWKELNESIRADRERKAREGVASK